MKTITIETIRYTPEMDAECAAEYARTNKRNKDLQHALVTRVLTDDEMTEVLELGSFLLVEMHYTGNGSGSGSGGQDSDRHFLDLLEAQGRLRIYQKSLEKKT